MSEIPNPNGKHSPTARFLMIACLSTVVPIGGVCGLGFVVMGFYTEEPLVMAVLGAVVIVIFASLGGACGTVLLKKPPVSPPPGICMCGYLLIGNTTGKCPECGRPL